jgi:oligopeptide transport system ATP-binding protein
MSTESGTKVGRVLEVKDLQTHFFTRDGVVKAVDGITYHVDEGEVVGIVGESGCGKSVSALSVMRLVADPPGKIVGGEIYFEGEDILAVDDSEMRNIRGNRIGMVFQEPMTSLNPVLTIGRQLTETLELHQNMDREQAEERAAELLGLVGIADARSRLSDYPHQFSGGMRQRVMIAMALSCNPKLIIADEPTTALDVTIQAQILELMRDLAIEFGTAMIIITHNLGVVARYAQRVIVMYAGKIIEVGTAHDIYENPKHPYTLGLLQSVPRLDEVRAERLDTIEGLPPDLIEMPDRCSFAPRCRYATDQCWSSEPRLEEFSEGHTTACWRSGELSDLIRSAHAEP